MSDIFAKAGEAVTTSEGKIVCYLKNHLHRHHAISADDFDRFADGEGAWKAGMPVDERCVRVKPQNLGGLQICINGEWRP